MNSFRNRAGRGSGSIFIILLIIVFLVTWAPGCLKIINQQTGAGQMQIPASNENVSSADVNRSLVSSPSVSPTISSSSGGTPPPWLARYGNGAGSADSTQRPAPDSTLSSSPSIPDFVRSAPPEPTPDPYPVQHATQINGSCEPSRQVQIAKFRQTYALRGNSTGLTVNATALEGPLTICFKVKPLYDCIKNPDSCRGKTDTGKSINLQSISLPYFTLTIRNDQTRELITEDGYGGIYSSQITNRTISIYNEGRYHLTLSGNSVDVTLSVGTGPVCLLNEDEDTGQQTISSSKGTPPGGFQGRI